MSLSPRQQQELNDQSWNWAIGAGREELGNLEVNLKFLEQTQLLRPQIKVVELGCGTGSLCQALYQQGIDIAGCDVSQVAIDHGQKKYPHLNLSVVNAEQLPWQDGTCDAVLSFDVLEHLYDPDGHLTEVYRVLKPDGYYLFQTPNKWVNAIFETLKTHSFAWRRYHPSLHFAGQLKRRLTNHGFGSQFVKMNTINAFTLKKLESYPRLKTLTGRLDFRRLPLWMQTNFYVIARKIQKG
jgi:2-polyprenyl-3-methyl-5-hydroxy-6-metoxy-1,4-benzoquinol methylase